MLNGPIEKQTQNVLVQCVTCTNYRIISGHFAVCPRICLTKRQKYFLLKITMAWFCFVSSWHWCYLKGIYCIHTRKEFLDDVEKCCWNRSSNFCSLFGERKCCRFQFPNEIYRSNSIGLLISHFTFAYDF